MKWSSGGSGARGRGVAPIAGETPEMRRFPAILSVCLRSFPFIHSFEGTILRRLRNANFSNAMGMIQQAINPTAENAKNSEKLKGAPGAHRANQTEQGVCCEIGNTLRRQALPRPFGGRQAKQGVDPSHGIAIGSCLVCGSRFRLLCDLCVLCGEKSRPVSESQDCHNAFLEQSTGVILLLPAGNALSQRSMPGPP